MPSENATVQTYVDLAAWYHRQGQASERDCFLELAADAAFNAGLPQEAEQLQARLLQYNPDHLLKSFPSFVQAMQSPKVKNHMAVLRRHHPPEEARRLLASLGEQGNGKEQSEGSLAKTTAAGTERSDASKAAVAVTPVEPPKRYPDTPVVRPKSAIPAPRPPAPTRPLTRDPPRPAAARASSAPVALAVPPPRPEPAKRPAPPPADPARQPAPPAQQADARSDVSSLGVILYELLTGRLPAQSPLWTRRPTAEGPDRTLNAWVPLGLFGLVLLVGAVLGAYTLAKPFLP